jgi:thiamine kinase-like enzyme
VRDLIEALHPDGTAPRSGSDLVIGLAGGAGLAPDGIAWIAVRPGKRALARARARRHGLNVTDSWLALPTSNPRLLLPLSSASATARRRLASRLAGGRLLHHVLGWKTRVVEELAPGVGLVAQRPGARPSLAWLADARVTGAVGIASGWHDAARLVLVGETMVVKTSKVGVQDELAREGRVLQELGPSVDRTGAHAPTVVYHGPAGNRAALVERALEGERASSILRKQPSRLHAVVAQVAEWLSRWHVETRLTRPFSEDDLQRLVVAPLRAVVPHLRDGAPYAERLESLGRALVGRDVPFAAAHNDLTTWNLLLDGDALSIVDWEAAERESLPLVDLEYLIVDAVATAQRAERDRAFRKAKRDAWNDAVNRLGIEREVAELARHACWLGHARNDLGRSARDSPFLAIVQSLAAS